MQTTGEIFFGVQAATRPQRRDNVGRNEALIEGLGAVATDRPLCFHKRRLREDVASFRCLAIRQEMR